MEKGDRVKTIDGLDMRESHISEVDWLQQIIDLLHVYHFEVAHFRSVRQQRPDGSVFWSTPVQADGAGWPDLVGVKGKRIIVIEAKVGRNKATAQQKHWLDILEMAGAESYVFYPSDWDEMLKIIDDKELE